MRKTPVHPRFTLATPARSNVLCGVLALLLVGGIGLQPCSAQQETVSKFVKDVREVQLVLLARDSRGRPIDNLRPQDFTIMDEGRPVPELSDFRRYENLPLQIHLVVDISGSMAKSLETAKPGISRFLETGLASSDSATLTTFHHQGRDEETAELLPSSLVATQASGLTPLYDTLHTLCEQALHQPRTNGSRSALVLISDGDDTESWNTLGEVISCVQQSGVPLYAITVHSGRVEYAGDASLRAIANASGGEFFVVSSGDRVEETLRRITGALRGYYLLSYRPTVTSRSKSHHSVRIASGNKGWRLDCRTGYDLAD